MRKNIWYAFLVGTGALVLSMVMIVIAVPLLGDEFQTTMFVNSVLGCYGIGSPVTYYCLKQAENLRLSNMQLLAAKAELEATKDALIERVRRDHMTGVWNREYFIEHTETRRKSSGIDTLLIIDVDHFKLINDRFGHQTGDRALKAITDAIRIAVRNDDVIGRIGGEEFSVFLPGADHDEAARIAERVRASVEATRFNPVGEGEEVLSLTVSIGGFVTARHQNDLSTMMGIADKNLYVAKNGGRNQVVLNERHQLAA